MDKYTSYDPDFDVLKEKGHWDDHTREIVEKRLQVDRGTYQFFTEEEADSLLHLCKVLVDDDRAEIIAFVVHHFDTKLQANFGEAQRKVGVPAEAVLLRDGLKLLNQMCQETYKNKFPQLDQTTKQKIVGDLVQGNLQLQVGTASVSAKDFIKKVMVETVSAYYSHPFVWSEIGYAGPAYPRGYVRTEWGLTDPWEAKREGKR